jgi:hypothetical protein
MAKALTAGQAKVIKKPSIHKDVASGKKAPLGPSGAPKTIDKRSIPAKHTSNKANWESWD